MPNFLGIVSAVIQILVKLSIKSSGGADKYVELTGEGDVEMKGDAVFIEPKSLNSVSLSDPTDPILES